jgi:hypothetical protein
LPAEFKLKDPEDLRAEDLAKLWMRHIQRRQQNSKFKGFSFTDEIHELCGAGLASKVPFQDKWSATEVSSVAALGSGNLDTLSGLIPFDTEPESGIKSEGANFSYVANNIIQCNPDTKVRLQQDSDALTSMSSF